MTDKQRERLEPPPKTGWPPGMLQDDSKKLSKWLASKPDARLHVREVAAAIRQEKEPTPQHPLQVAGQQQEEGNG